MKMITVQTSLKAPVEHCWKIWTTPADILRFNKPFKNWHTGRVDIDLKENGKLFYRMESLDGTEGFDFAGTYNKIIINEYIESTGTDGRKTMVSFAEKDGITTVTESFEPDDHTPYDLQKTFCQNILDNFSAYITGQESTAD